jgi:hypothetical protein
MADSLRGDPEGRRLAQKRAALLAEAGQVARALEVLLKRADFDPEDVMSLIREMAEREQVELHKGYGRIEPRRRFRPHDSHPLLKRRPRSGLFIDENGKSHTEPLARERPTVFCLGAIAMPEDAIVDYCAAADEVKREFFGRTDITFHEPNMRRRENIYHFYGEGKRQLEFDEAIDRLVNDANFVAFGVGIRKEAYAEQFVEAGLDPYLPTDVYPLAIMLLLERYIDFLHSEPVNRFGRVTFESIGTREDAEHQLEYARLLLDGSQWVPASAFRSWLETGLRFEPKAGSHPLELSDMLSRDLYEWVLSDCTKTPKRWELFSKKIRCRDDGRMGKFGVKVFPDSDIRERTIAHRAACGADIPEKAS